MEAHITESQKNKGVKLGKMDLWVESSWNSASEQVE